MKLSERIRPHSEVHPWIYKEILLLEAENERLTGQLRDAGISMRSAITILNDKENALPETMVEAAAFLRSRSGVALAALNPEGKSPSQKMHDAGFTKRPQGKFIGDDE